jgi:hypothetical protein
MAEIHPNFLNPELFKEAYIGYSNEYKGTKKLD